MLKSPVITKTLLIFASVSLKYQSSLRHVWININQEVNEPITKKEIHEISLWLKISLYKEKQNFESLILMYDMTLG